jgi:hypothetical protein
MQSIRTTSLAGFFCRLILLDEAAVAKENLVVASPAVELNGPKYVKTTGSSRR